MNVKNTLSKEEEAEKQLAWTAIICTTLSIVFSNYAPMIVFIVGWIDHFHEFKLTNNKSRVSKAIDKLKERYPNFVPSIDETFEGLV